MEKFAIFVEQDVWEMEDFEICKQIPLTKIYTLTVYGIFSQGVLFFCEKNYLHFWWYRILFAMFSSISCRHGVLLVTVLVYKKNMTQQLNFSRGLSK